MLMPYFAPDGGETVISRLVLCSCTFVILSACDWISPSEIQPGGIGTAVLDDAEKYDAMVGAPFFFEGRLSVTSSGNVEITSERGLGAFHVLDIDRLSFICVQALDGEVVTVLGYLGNDRQILRPVFIQTQRNGGTDVYECIHEIDYNDWNNDGRLSRL